MSTEPGEIEPTSTSMEAGKCFVCGTSRTTLYRMNGTGGTRSWVCGAHRSGSVEPVSAEVKAARRRLTMRPRWFWRRTWWLKGPTLGLAGLVLLVVILAIAFPAKTNSAGSASLSTPDEYLLHATVTGAPSPAAFIPVATEAPLSTTATPDALSVYATGIRHARSVLFGALVQLGTDIDAYNATYTYDVADVGTDNAVISNAVADAEGLPPPRGSDGVFVSVTQALEAIRKTSDNLSVNMSPLGFRFQENLYEMADHPQGYFLTASFDEARAEFSPELDALDVLIAKLPASQAAPVGNLNQQMEKSIRDNKYAAGDYTFDHLQVNYDAPSKVLTVDVNPNDKPDTALITDASELTIIAGTAIWSTYPQVQAITVKVYQPKHDTEVISDTYTRATGARLPYLHLNSQSAEDNKVMLCGADHFSVATYIWAQLRDKGCMTAPTGGTKP